MSKEPRRPTPQTRNPVETRERILLAAISLFAARGYNGVPVDAIVRAAQVNKRMVYHYFESKAGLYGAVLARVFERLNRVEAELSLEAEPVGTGIEKIIRAYFAFLDANPEFVSLLLWENLLGGKNLDALPPGPAKAPILQALDTMITRGIESGELRPGIDRRHMLINLIGLCLIYYSNRHTLSRTIGLDLSSAEELARGINHAIALAKHGYLHLGE